MNLQPLQKVMQFTRCLIALCFGTVNENFKVKRKKCKRKEGGMGILDMYHSV